MPPSPIQLKEKLLTAIDEDNNVSLTSLHAQMEQLAVHPFTIN